MKSESKVEEVLGLDDPRTVLLVEDVGRIANQLKKAPSSDLYFALFKADRNAELKSLRLKVRTLSTLSATLIRLKLELLIVDCE
jgi:hypothetical protein